MCYIDLGDKNQWLLDFNGGFVPVLENTDGTMIPESGIIASTASWNCLLSIFAESANEITFSASLFG